MKYIIKIMLFTILVVVKPLDVMGIEEAKYDLVKKDNNFEIRDYAGHILAETVVEGNLEDAGNEAFKRLFRYISGDNRSGDKIAMTAPVSQEPRSEKIKMTAPVGQQRSDDAWVVSFMIPSSYTLRTLPKPKDPKVRLRQVPPRRIAAIRYSGFWSEKGYLRQKVKLESWIQKNGLDTVGDPIWARYNSPFMPWFLRRNEILIPIDGGIGREGSKIRINTSPLNLNEHV